MEYVGVSTKSVKSKKVSKKPLPDVSSKKPSPLPVQEVEVQEAIPLKEESEMDKLNDALASIEAKLSNLD